MIKIKEEIIKIEEEIYKDTLKTISKKHEYERRLLEIDEERRKLQEKIQELKNYDEKLYWEYYRVEDTIKGINLHEFEKDMLDNKKSYVKSNWYISIYNNGNRLISDVKSGRTKIYKNSEFREKWERGALGITSHKELRNEDELYGWLYRNVNHNDPNVKDKVYNEIENFLNRKDD